MCSKFVQHILTISGRFSLFSSPEMKPLNSVPQIRIEMDPDDDDDDDDDEDNGIFWKTRGSETSL